MEQQTWKPAYEEEPEFEEEVHHPEDGGGYGCGCIPNIVFFMLLLVGIGTAAWSWYYWNALEARGPVHVLVLGIDERAGEHGPFRSDTMILTHFDPRTHRVISLSIPRDLWVSVPNYGENRINTANFFGGPALAKQAVSSAFGLPVHYYVRINFEGFVNIIDAMGGVTVEVPETLHDERYPTSDYGVQTVHIDAGTQHMDGETALIYARSRASTSDFDRGRRQQQLLVAVKRKLQRPTTWLRLPLIVSAVITSVETDMPLNEWPALGLITIRADNVDRLTIGPDQTTPFITAQGAAVLLPNWEQINPLLDQMR